MTETASTPDPYIDDSAPAGLEVDLHIVIDPMVLPKEAGEDDPGTRPGSQELRNEKWEQLHSIFDDLREETGPDDGILGIEIGDVNNCPGFSLGIAIAVEHTASVLSSGFIPTNVLELTKHEELRLVDESPGTTPSRVYSFALPRITEVSSE